MNNRSNTSPRQETTVRLTRRKFVAGIAATVAGTPELARGLSSAALQLAPSSLASDPRRPQYHFLPPANWMNDPNGPIYWMEKYHLFYQYNPGATVWGDMHWGHAVSEDMVHWRHLPPALSPTPGGPDAAGCFTGSAIVRDGAVSVVYTVSPKSLVVPLVRNIVRCNAWRPPLNRTFVPGSSPPCRSSLHLQRNSTLWGSATLLLGEQAGNGI